MTLRVLHIDDEADIREVVAISLSLDSDFEVRNCDSATTGIVAAAEDLPDLILLDVMMPIMDGPTTLARLRENPRTAAIPVIFMTARAQSREIEQFKLLGAAGVIAKPFDPMTLAATVRSHIRPNDVLASSRRIFVRRVNSDAETLIECWLALLTKTADRSVLGRIQSLAHGLAGAAGIFGFAHIGSSAANLEDAVICEFDSPNEMREVERAIEHLLTSIRTHMPDYIGQVSRRVDA